MEFRKPVPHVVWQIGLEEFAIPVIDVTDPRFQLDDTAQAASALEVTYEIEEQRQARTPRILSRMMLKLGARQSRLLQGMVNTSGDFLGGLHTYLMKLGPENLPAGINTQIDKRVAATPHATFMRLRLQQFAHFLADGLKKQLQSFSATSLHLINIAGGPAIDTLNALILLNRQDPTLLDRAIRISVLDIDTGGPAFGAKVLSVLLQDGQALSGLNVEFRHHSYDWNQSQFLAEMVLESVSSGAILAVSSEGGLFEYGSDDAILSNLAALHADGTGAKLVVGSVTCSDSLRRASIARTHYKLVPRGADGLAPLAEKAGYELAMRQHTPLSDQITLTPISR